VILTDGLLLTSLNCTYLEKGHSPKYLKLAIFTKPFRCFALHISWRL